MITLRGLGVAEGHDARHVLALEQFERGAAASGDKGDLLLHVVLGRRSGRVTAANDTLVARLGLGRVARSAIDNFGLILVVTHMRNT